MWRRIKDVLWLWPIIAFGIAWLIVMPLMLCDEARADCTPIASQGWQEQVCVVPAAQLSFGPLPIECKIVAQDEINAQIRCFTGEYVSPKWVAGKKPVCQICKPIKRKRKR